MRDSNTKIIDIINRLVIERDGLSEIELNGPNLLFIKENGVRKQIKFNITTEDDYNAAINGLIEAAGLRWNDFLVEGRLNLPKGKTSRLHITMPPASVYPTVTIAIKSDDLSDLAAIQGMGSFNSEIMRFLKMAVDAKLTIVISGGTGAGKTTLLEALTNEFNMRERIGVCEDSPELQLKSPNTAYLNSTVWVPGLDPNSVAPLSWCVQQINRMRVDRILVGETRGKEFFDFITAANSGAEGSMTTIHANDVDSALKKMTSFMYMSVDLAPRIINEMISEAVDVIIQLGKSKVDGRIVIEEIAEVTEQMAAGESPRIVKNTLYIYSNEDDDWGKYYATDKFKERLELHGYNPNTYRKEEQSVMDEGRRPSVSPSVGLPTYFKGGE